MGKVSINRSLWNLRSISTISRLAFSIAVAEKNPPRSLTSGAKAWADDPIHRLKTIGSQSHRAHRRTLVAAESGHDCNALVMSCLKGWIFNAAGQVHRQTSKRLENGFLPPFDDYGRTVQTLYGSHAKRNSGSTQRQGPRIKISVWRPWIPKNFSLASHFGLPRAETPKTLRGFTFS